MDEQSTQTSRPRGRKPVPPVELSQLGCRKYAELLHRHVSQLRTLYQHPNRVLFYDDVVIVYLLAFFNPTLRSLRCIEHASEIPGINKFLSVESVCKSTLSDANALFDPKHLGGLIESLREDLPNLHQTDGQLDKLLERARAFDGSYFRVAADVQWALHQRKPDKKPMGQVRLDCEFCLKTGVPKGVLVTGDEGISEGAAAQELLENKPPDEPDGREPIYLFDSGVVKFSYLRAIVERQHHFLCNLREHILLETATELPLDDAARAAGVLSDRKGYLASSHAPRGADRAPAVLMREIRVAYTDRHGNTRHLRLLTNLIDLPAHLIAELYKHRWEIELFFRWLKVHANFRHLTSHTKNGVLLGFHIAIIAMLLTSLHTQASLSKYNYSLLSLVANGQATIEDILPIVFSIEEQRKRERERQARKRAEKKKQQA